MGKKIFDRALTNVCPDVLINFKTRWGLNVRSLSRSPGLCIWRDRYLMFGWHASPASLPLVRTLTEVLSTVDLLVKVTYFVKT
jgi:hypothetical protein